MSVFTPAELAQSAIVFAPHADDETLGCGGTIVLKAMALAPVWIVIVTDSSRSHTRLMSPELMKAHRQAEAKAAAAKLGLRESRVIFMNLPEGRLQEHWHEGIDTAVALLAHHRPDQVFIPYAHDSHRDHIDVNRMVLQALERHRQGVQVFEYPVWLWNRWPWTRPRCRGLQQYTGAMASGLFQSCWRRYFTRGAYIGNVRDQKMAALNEYKSQMTRLVDDARWATLGDVSKGEFLSCFFQEHEVFFPRRRAGI